MRRLVLMFNVALVLVSAGLVVYIFGVKEEPAPPVIDYIGNECEEAHKNLYSGPFTATPCDDLRRLFERWARERETRQLAPPTTAPPTAQPPPSG